MYWRIGIALLVAIFAGITGYGKGYENGKETVQKAWDTEKAELQAKYTEALKESIEKQQKLQMGADRLREEKNRETRDLVARNTALANSLRDRQSRPAQTSAVSSAPSVGQNSCTGKELYREDGEFLVGIAREADELRAALKQCYTQYDQVRQSYEQRR